MAAVAQVRQTVGLGNFMFAAVFVAFVIYITAKGRLGTYLQMFFYSNPVSTAAATPTNTSGLTVTNSGGTLAPGDVAASNQGSVAAVNTFGSGIAGVLNNIGNMLGGSTTAPTQALKPGQSTGGIGAQ